MKITPVMRHKLEFYLKNFYERYPSEKYTIFHFVRYFKARLKKNKDAWTAVSGDTGVGKSYFVLMAQILFGRRMTMDGNVAYIPEGDEIMKMFDKLKMQTLLIDEAAREMRSVNWQSKQQQGVNVKAMTDRFKNNWVFLNMPNFLEFTKSMRVGNLQFRAILPYRTETHARVVLQRKSRNWRHPDPWLDEQAMKVYEKVEKKYKELSNDRILTLERNLPVTVMDFIVPDLRLILPEVVQYYESKKEESRKQAGDPKDMVKMNKFKHELRDYKKKMAHMLFYNKLGIGRVKLTKKDMAEALGMNVTTFSKMLSEPVEKKKTFREKEKIK